MVLKVDSSKLESVRRAPSYNYLHL